MTTNARSRTRIRSIAQAAAVGIVLLGLAACSGGSPLPTAYPDITAPPPTPVGTAAPSEAAPTEPAAPASSLPAEIAGVDTTDWQQVATPGGAVTFRVPSDWTVEPATGGLDIAAPGGRSLQYREGAAGDVGCVGPDGQPSAWRTALGSREDVQVAGATGIQLAANAVQLGGSWYLSVGLLPAAQAQSPRCPIVNEIETSAGTIGFGSQVHVTGADGGSAWQIGSPEEAAQFLASEEGTTLRAVFSSLEVVAP